ncbi:hypothetical protein [Mucilaginibacter celer]|uniref:Uncharacterized protein n=1 Tax=Mucilaginibacter celer TaxID=2305508 RepID=A0A494VRX7_9SPHI|nr:hypothetical protein [Mucilaginibacter celer]AYL96801.1 hypothetical protein HYN43_016490 [Mucilaginibacter celer]
MSENTQTAAVDINEMYHYAANLQISGKNVREIKAALLERGLDEANTNIVIGWLSEDTSNEVKERAKKDMLYGALWCVGGLVLTFAHIGFIFWGAILFGGIQFFKGVINYNS